MAPLTLALALGGCAPPAGPADPTASALASTPSASPTPSPTPTLSAEELQWLAEREAQLAIAASFADSPQPAAFDVTASDDVNQVLLSGRAASYPGYAYVMMRWSMGGRSFPGVGGLVRFTGSVTGLYRVTTLVGELVKGDPSTHGPFHQAIAGLERGAYDAAFQTSWGGSESHIRIWVLMRVGD